MRARIADLALLLVLVTLAVPAGAAPGHGDSPAAPIRMAQSTTQQSAFDNETLFKFASAALNIRNIFQNNKQQLKNVQSKQEKRKIENKIRRAIRKAIDNAGLSVRTYKKINKAMKNNRRLRQRVGKLIQKMKGTN